MNFNNANNNSRDAVNVNTRGLQFMNSEGFSPSTLLFGFWNSLISIKVHPALEKSQQTESNRFNYQEVVNTAITLEKTVTLAEAVKDVILPAFKAGEETSEFVPVGGNSLIGVGTRVSDGNTTAYLGIFKNLDEETKKPETGIYYEFKNGYTVTNYDPKTGNFSVKQNIPSELMLFLAALNVSVGALTNATAHSIRVTDKWFRDRITKELEEIGGKLGIQKSKGNWGGSNGGYKSNKSDMFSGVGSNQSSNSGIDLDGGSASISKLSNIDDINQFM